MQSAFANLDWLAIVLATLSAFVLGSLWYSKLLFGKRWMKETGITEESAKQASMLKTFGLSFVLLFFAAFFLAMFVGTGAGVFGAVAGFMAGLGWVFTFMGVVYLFEFRTLALFLINACYSVISLTIMGLIIGVMQ